VLVTEKSRLIEKCHFGQPRVENDTSGLYTECPRKSGSVANPTMPTPILMISLRDG
jgi:hypothetical protein